MFILGADAWLLIGFISQKITICIVKEVERGSRTMVLVKWLKVKVKINANCPLIEGCWLNVSNGKRFWVDFKYEKLLDFCYMCARLSGS